MTINGTLIVQALNFFIVYWLLRTLFFKPAVLFLEQEQQENDQYVQRVAHLEQQLQTAQHRFSEDEKAMIKKRESCYPSERKDVIFTFEDVIPHVVKMDEHKDDLVKLKHEVVAELRQKVFVQ